MYGRTYHQNPARAFEEMRRHGPVVPILLEGDVPGWLVLGYRELRYVLSNPKLFTRDSRQWNQWDNIPPDWPLMAYVGYQPSMLFEVGAAHERRAGALSEALAAADQFELRAHCERVVEGLINAFIGSGRADLIAQYAVPIPLLALGSMLGLPDQDTRALLGEVATALNGGPAAMEAYQRIQAIMTRLLESKRQRPGPDLPSRLLAHPAKLTDEELTQDLLLTLTAGDDPTATWIGNTLQLMLTDDRFAMTLSGGRSSIGQALNEVLWKEAPGQIAIGRWPVMDTQLSGRRIRAGDLLVCGLAAANLDPAVHPDFYRDSMGNHAHMTFGYGAHGCPHPAPELAEIIAHIAVEMLLDRLPDVVLAVPPETLEWRTSIQMRSLKTLPVEFTPGYPT
ncbi:cytochrome P450 [Nonomuraea sp. K274]|uniref:Cytochrome P450 n=2 Tax=Nonomuraea cypriaca TaxID=1187855 RepID=A0A931A0Z6_9ACTN|nr:cytochrome P450 [Nonomuraea cypriaca]